MKKLKKLNIVFIGYRGSGKSTISLLLSKKLKMPLLSSDKILEKQFNCSIKDYISNHSWEEFRLEEEKSYRKIISKERSHY